MRRGGARYSLLVWLDPADPQAWSGMRRGLGWFSHVSLLGYAVDAEGRVHDAVATPKPELRHRLASLRRAGARVLMALGCQRCSEPVVPSLVTDPAARERAIAAVCELCRRDGLDGVNVFFEEPFPDTRDALSAFVEELAWEVHRIRGLVAVTAAPQVRDPEDEPAEDAGDPEGRRAAWSRSFDYRSLGVYADLFIAHTLDFARGSVPVQGTPIGWLESVIDHALMHVPPRRFLITLPLYGREWNAEGHPSGIVPMAGLPERLGAASRVVEEADRAGGGRRLRVSDTGTADRQILIDSIESLAEKAALVVRHDLGGLALWRLGYETPDVWPALARALALGDPP